MYKILALLLLAATLSGCGLFKMSEAECRSTNWPDRGYSDGLSGRQARDLSGAVKDCASYGVSVNQDGYHRGWQRGLYSYCTPERGYATGSRGQQAIDYCPRKAARRYVRGWEKGVRRYCVPRNGYALGKAGKPMPDICPGDLYARFQEEYDRGYKHYKRVKALTDQEKALENRIATISQTMDRNDNQIEDASRAGDSKQVNQLSHDNRQLRRELRNLQLEKTSLAIIITTID